MNNINKGLHNPLAYSLDDYFAVMCEDTLDDYLELIFADTLDDYLELIFADTDIDSWFTDPVLVEDKPKPVWNETEHWLYNAKCENYERVLKVVQNKTPYNRRFKLPEDEIVSYFHQYLSEFLIEKNKLKKEIDKGKNIKPSVVYEWFLQYVVREKYKEGKDALQRCSGARTQSEVTKVKAYETEQTDTPYAPSHHIKNLETQGWKVRQMVSKTDSDTGDQMGEPDYYDYEDETLSLEEKSANAYMKKLLLKKFGQAKINMYYSLWLEFRYQEYESRRKWAKARKVSYRVLTNQIEQITSLFLENREAFGH